MLEHEKIAGGMFYRIMENINTSITEYLSGHDKKSSSEILEKNKE